jgi:thiamine biosynthesis lipoprotein
MALLFITCLAGVARAEDDSEYAFEVPSLSGEQALPFRHTAMYTDFVFMLYPRPGDVGYDDMLADVTLAFEAIDQLEREVSSWSSVSNTSEINKHAGERPVKMRSSVRSLLKFSKQVHRDTGGTFDVTVGPLIDLWRGYEESGGEPSDEELHGALARVGTDKIVLNPAEGTAQFSTSGMRISFGGIAKGLALDVAAKVLKEKGFTLGLLKGSLSSILALGPPPGEEYWRIGIRNPYNKEKKLGWIHLRDQSVSTSACYDSVPAATVGGPCNKYDPRTGRRATGILSAVVVAPTGMQTDALSTAFFVAGVEGARRYCEQHPEVKATMVPLLENGPAEPVLIGGET